MATQTLGILFQVDKCPQANNLGLARSPPPPNLPAAGLLHLPLLLSYHQ